MARKIPSEFKQERKLIGERIKAHRERLGLSMEKLGKQCDTFASSVHRWERGAMPAPDQAAKLMQLFGDPFLFKSTTAVREDTCDHDHWMIGEGELQYWFTLVQATGVSMRLGFLLELLNRRKEKEGGG